METLTTILLLLFFGDLILGVIGAMFGASIGLLGWLIGGSK